MKYYETTFEDYIYSTNQQNYHHELISIFEQLPAKMEDLQNIIFYGPPGSGKYSQILRLIKKYSPSQNLKFDKIILKNEKQTYNFHISEIHYEVDMSLLGCHSKTLWYDIFQQIIEVVSTKPKTCGIIVCKNFHNIHNELLEIFYSYMQKNHGSSINMKFILMTENISFIPNNIIRSCKIIRCKQPDISCHINTQSKPARVDLEPSIFNFRKRIQTLNHVDQNEVYHNIMESISSEDIMNMKDLKYLSISDDDIPKDIFNSVCDEIIDLLLNNRTKPVFLQQLRDVIYEIFTYNLDVSECIWYILNYLITYNHIKDEKISDLLVNITKVLQYYNNNYRPIYHLENILLSITVVLDP